MKTEEMKSRLCKIPSAKNGTVYLIVGLGEDEGTVRIAPLGILEKEMSANSVFYATIKAEYVEIVEPAVLSLGKEHPQTAPSMDDFEGCLVSNPISAAGFAAAFGGCEFEFEFVTTDTDVPPKFKAGDIVKRDVDSKKFVVISYSAHEDYYRCVDCKNFEGEVLDESEMVETGENSGFNSTTSPSFHYGELVLIFGKVLGRYAGASARDRGLGEPIELLSGKHIIAENELGLSRPSGDARRFLRVGDKVLLGSVLGEISQIDEGCSFDEYRFHFAGNTLDGQEYTQWCAGPYLSILPA